MKQHVKISPKQSLVLQPWKGLSREQKRREIVRYAQVHRGHAVTLNLGPEFADYLMLKDKPMREVGKRMNAELQKKDLNHLPILMVLEATKDTSRLHLHGAYIGSGVSRSSIQRAMRRAVGFVAGRSGSRQFMAKLIYESDGWANYLGKHTKWTMRLLDLSSDDHLWWISRTMTQMVCHDYEAVRKGQKPPANFSSTRPSAV